MIFMLIADFDFIMDIYKCKCLVTCDKCTKYENDILKYAKIYANKYVISYMAC